MGLTRRCIPTWKTDPVHAPVFWNRSSGKKSNLYHHKYINRKSITKNRTDAFFPSFSESTIVTTQPELPQ